MKITHIASPRQFCATLAALALAAALAACGSGATASGGDSTLAVPTPARAVQATAIAAPSVAAAPSAAPSVAPTTAPSAAVSAVFSSAASVAPSMPYSGARWQDLPIPGSITPHQEETGRYSIFVAGTQKDVIALYTAAYLADGWVEASRSTANGSAFFTYTKSGRSVVVAIGPDLGTNSIIVVIDDSL